MQIRYKNAILKSKHEFAWALHFDRAKMPWEYEAATFRDGHAAYTPDFSLHRRTLFIEIKVWGATRINQIHLCPFPLLLIFGMPERHYIRLKPAGMNTVQAGHFTSWERALEKVAA